MSAAASRSSTHGTKMPKAWHKETIVYFDSTEIAELQDYGIHTEYAPDDCRPWDRYE
jgi:hypothetical protein